MLPQEVWGIYIEVGAILTYSYFYVIYLLLLHSSYFIRRIY